MLEVLAAGFPHRMPEWAPRLDALVPPAQRLGPDRLPEALARARRLLGLDPDAPGEAAP